MNKAKIRIKIETYITTKKEFETVVVVPVDDEYDGSQHIFVEDDITSAAIKAAKKHFTDKKRKNNAKGDELCDWEWYTKDSDFCELGPIEILEHTHIVHGIPNWRENQTCCENEVRGMDGWCKNCGCPCY